MSNKITSYLPTDTEIADIAVKFNFKDKIELRYGINNAYWQLKIFSYAKRTLRDPSVLIKELNKCSKDLQNVVSRLSGPELSCLMDKYDNGFEDFIYEIANDLSLLERLTENTLVDIPSAVFIAKKIPVWWFVWELADLWKAEIGTRPTCRFSTINGYTGKFYRFVMEVASLNNDQIYVTGATIKNVLAKWHEANPMYQRKTQYD
jgi:hypothetical protein